MPPRPGEIYWVIDAVEDPHPLVVVSRQDLNRGSYVTVVPFTSARLETRKHLPNCVAIQAGQFGLMKACVAQADQIATIFKTDLDLEGGPIGTLGADAMRAVVRAVGHVIDAECEPM